MKFVTKDLKDFQDWLKVNLEDGVKKHVAKELARVNKVLVS